MKKLIIAMAMAASVAAFADVESANVVGFNTLNDGNPSVMLGSVFQSVSGETDGVKLSELVGDFVSYDEIQVSYMEEGLIYFTVYQYLTVDEGVDADGWYDGSWESAADVVIPRGAAVWFISTSGAAKDATVAGAVPAAQTVHPAFTEQSSMICSAYPIAFNPNATSVAWTGLQSYDEIQVSYMEEGLIYFTVYQWLTEDDGVEAAGWYDGAWELVTAPIARVGQGFWLILNDPANVTMVETSPLSK